MNCSLKLYSNAFVFTFLCVYATVCMCVCACVQIVTPYSATTACIWHLVACLSDASLV